MKQRDIYNPGIAMLHRLLFLTLVLLVAVDVSAESDFFKKFRDDYATLDQDLLNNEGEIGHLTNLVYKKDVATFTFTDGTIALLRYVNGRPTTAIFIGKGSVTIDVPSHLERQNLRYASGDSTVNQTFELCFMRIGDDFDLKVKDQATLKRQVLDWKDFNLAKKAQGEFFFFPRIEHTWDNWFELLRSCYERQADGFFFADFNRYTYMFDPYRPEQVIVGYEHEGGDQVITEAAVFQRQERRHYDDSVMSDIAYPTTIADRQGTFSFGGMEGNTIEAARADLKVVLNADSARFVNLFLHYNLSLDSVAIDGQRIDSYRRKEFNVVGLFLPRYFHAGDTLNVSLWYSGKNYTSLFPWVENPAASTTKLTCTAPGDFNYIMPGMSNPEPADRGKQRFVAEPMQPFNLFTFRSYAKSFTPVPFTTEAGLPITFLQSPQLSKSRFECFVAHEIYQPAVLGAVNFMAARMGNPPGTFDLSVFPEGGISMPGLLEVPQVQCMVEGQGGIQLSAGIQSARQWFGSGMRPASDREMWLADALPEYLGLMYLQSAVPPGNLFYSELLYRQQKLHTFIDRGWDQPLAAGDRVSDTIRAFKGAFVIHMLRQMMTDLDKQSELPFLRFLQTVASLTNTRTFTNTDIQKAAEKFYGQPLDWFFNQWVYGIGIPEYTANYNIAPKDNQWVIDVALQVDKVASGYTMPIVLGVTYDDGTAETFTRQMVKGTQASFQLGPFAKKPKGLVFNEFVSVLSKDKTGKLKS